MVRWRPFRSHIVIVPLCVVLLLVIVAFSMYASIQEQVTQLLEQKEELKYALDMATTKKSEIATMELCNSPSLTQVYLSVVLVLRNNDDWERLYLTELSIRIAEKRANKIVQIVKVAVGGEPQDVSHNCHHGSSILHLVPVHDSFVVSTSMARGYGLSIASGEWVVFPTPGDYYNPVWIEQLYYTLYPPPTTTPAATAASASSKDEPKPTEKPREIEMPKIDPISTMVLYWNTADSSDGYLWHPQSVTRLFMTNKLHVHSGLIIADGSFAIRTKALVSTGGYPVLSCLVDGHDEALTLLRQVAPTSLIYQAPPYDRGNQASFIFWSNKAVRNRVGPKTGDRPFLSVVIAAGGKRYLDLQLMLEAMRLQTVACWEVIVVNNGPDEYTKSYIEEKFKEDGRVRYFDVEHNWLFGHPSRELGLSHVRGEWVLITNDDNYYVPTLVEILLAGVVTRGYWSVQMIWFSMVHNYPYFQYRLVGTNMFSMGSNDMGCAIVRTDVAQRVGFPFRQAIGDWEYFHAVSEAIYDANEPRTAFYVAQERMVFVHN